MGDATGSVVLLALVGVAHLLGLGAAVGRDRARGDLPCRLLIGRAIPCIGAPGWVGVSGRGARLPLLTEPGWRAWEIVCG